MALDDEHLFAKGPPFRSTLESAVDPPGPPPESWRASLVSYQLGGGGPVAGMGGLGGITSAQSLDAHSETYPTTHGSTLPISPAAMLWHPAAQDVGRHTAPIARTLELL